MADDSPPPFDLAEARRRIRRLRREFLEVFAEASLLPAHNPEARDKVLTDMVELVVLLDRIHKKIGKATRDRPKAKRAS